MKSISDSSPLPVTDADTDAAIAQDMDFFDRMRRHPAPLAIVTAPTDSPALDIVDQAA